MTVAVHLVRHDGIVRCNGVTLGGRRMGTKDAPMWLRIFAGQLLLQAWGKM